MRFLANSIKGFTNPIREHFATSNLSEFDASKSRIRWSQSAYVSGYASLIVLDNVFAKTFLCKKKTFFNITTYICTPTCFLSSSAIYDVIMVEGDLDNTEKDVMEHSLVLSGKRLEFLTFPDISTDHKNKKWQHQVLLCALTFLKTKSFVLCSIWTCFYTTT